jgi:membrane-bound lytic murein transglycosylase B
MNRGVESGVTGIGFTQRRQLDACPLPDVTQRKARWPVHEGSMTTVGRQRITTYGHQVKIPRSPLTRALVVGVPAVVLLSGQVAAASRNVSWGGLPGPTAADQAWLSSLTGAQVAEPDGSLADVDDPNQAVLPDGGDPAHLSATDGLVVAGQPVSTAAAGTAGDTSLASGLVSNGIPVRVLQSYLAAASVMSRRQASCHLSWSLLAGIGRVESDHGRHGGNRIGRDGLVRPGIYGPRLDGSAGTAVIRDSDGGRYDGDAGYDRAVGPMQFIPGTWRIYGTDANGDGLATPQNMDDAALSAGRYLCAGGRDLGTTAGRWSAILTYNHSNEYAATVSALADSYATGVAAAVPAVPSGVTAPPASTVGPGTTTLAPAVVPQVAPTTPVTSTPTGQTTGPTDKATTVPASSPSTSSPHTPDPTSTTTTAGASTGTSQSPSPSPTPGPSDPTTPSPTGAPTTPAPLGPTPAVTPSASTSAAGPSILGTTPPGSPSADPATPSPSTFDPSPTPAATPSASPSP